MKAWTGAGFPLAILLSLTILTLWLKHAAELPDVQPTNKMRHDPDTIIDQFTATAINSMGAPIHQLQADKLVHYADDDSSELDNPRVRLTPDPLSTLTMRANSGKMIDGNDEIQLTGQVTIDRLPGNNQEGWSATMPDLTVYPPSSSAMTKSPFIFKQGSATLTGTGFFVDQRTQTATLNAKVRANFPARKQAP